MELCPRRLGILRNNPGGMREATPKEGPRPPPNFGAMLLESDPACPGPFLLRSHSALRGPTILWLSPCGGRAQGRPRFSGFVAGWCGPSWQTKPNIKLAPTDLGQCRQCPRRANPSGFCEGQALRKARNGVVAGQPWPVLRKPDCGRRQRAKNPEPFVWSPRGRRGGGSPSRDRMGSLRRHSAAQNFLENSRKPFRSKATVSVFFLSFKEFCVVKLGLRRPAKDRMGSLQRHSAAQKIQISSRKPLNDGTAVGAASV